MPRSWNFIFNSVKGEGQMTNIDTNTHTVKFPSVEWERVLPQGKYKLTWSYSGSGNMLTARDTTYIQLEGLRLDSNLEPITNGATNTINLGILKQRGRNLYQANSNTNFNIGYLDGNLDDNPPIYLNSRPHNGQLTINIRTPSNFLWVDDTGKQASAGIMNKGNNTTDVGGLREVPTRARFFIGSVLWYQTGGYTRFNKIVDFNSDYRGQPYAPTTPIQFYKVMLGYGFATGTLSTEIETATIDQIGGGGQNPGHYILTLNFELID